METMVVSQWKFVMRAWFQVLRVKPWLGVDTVTVSDYPAEVERHLLSILARRSDGRMDDLPQMGVEDHKSLPNVGKCRLVGEDRSRPSGPVPGDAGLLLEQKLASQCLRLPR